LILPLGKTTVAIALSQKLNFTFIEGDDYHPVTNKEKMASGIPLNDEDRKPWLKLINAKLKQCQEENLNCIVSCSALKKDYRNWLANGIDVPFGFLSLEGSYEAILNRLNARAGHFMPPILLKSQFDTWERLSQDEEWFKQADVGEKQEEMTTSRLKELGVLFWQKCGKRFILRVDTEKTVGQIVEVCKDCIELFEQACSIR